MMTDTNWEGGDVLIPRRFLEARAEALASTRLDLGALIAVLPCAHPAQFLSLAEADIAQCRAWIGSVIRALPTRPMTDAADVQA